MISQHWIKINNTAYNINQYLNASILFRKGEYKIFMGNTIYNSDTECYETVTMEQALQFIDIFNRITGVKLELPKE